MLTISDYHFEKINNTECSDEGDAFDTLDSATGECKDNKNCQGILSMNCNEQEKYHICLTNATMTTSVFHVKSCFYRKTPIGKHFPTF